MINGAHVVLSSRDADADRAFLHELLCLPAVDVGGGWLIMALPAAEVAVHPAARNGHHELYLMCDDIENFVAAMRRQGTRCAPVRRQPWGLLTAVSLPGGGKLGVYQPLHRRPSSRQQQRERRPSGASGKRGAKR